MAAKKKKPGRPPQGRSPAFVVYARVDPAFEAIMERYLSETEPAPTQTAVIETALKEFFRARGYWPPPDDTAEPQQKSGR
jgi:hypothetical protein